MTDKLHMTNVALLHLYVDIKLSVCSVHSTLYNNYNKNIVFEVLFTNSRLYFHWYKQLRSNIGYIICFS